MGSRDILVILPGNSNKSIFQLLLKRTQIPLGTIAECYVCVFLCDILDILSSSPKYNGQRGPLQLFLADTIKGRFVGFSLHTF